MQKRMIVGIEYIRAIACSMVLLSHYIGMLPADTRLFGGALDNTPLRIVWGGSAAVIIFFAISGFFLYKEEPIFNFKTYAAKIVKRFKRIYPGYIIVMLLTLLAYITRIEYEQLLFTDWGANFWQTDVTLKNFLLQFILVAPFNSDLLNPVVWTLRVEAQLIFITPFFGYALSRSKKSTVDMLIAFVAGVLSIEPHLAYLPAFVLGMLTRKHAREALPKKTSLLFLLVGIALVDTFYVNNWLSLNLSSGMMRFMTSLGACLLISFAKDVKRDIKWMRFLGNHSFYIYLVHMPVFLWLRFMVEYTGYAVYGLCAVTVTVIIAIAVRRIEAYLLKTWQKTSARIRKES